MRSKEKIRECKQKGHQLEKYNENLDICKNCGAFVAKAKLREAKQG